MQRREFLVTAVSATVASKLAAPSIAAESSAELCCTYASPADAMASAPETIAYVPAIYTGTVVRKPDYLATVDVDPLSRTFSQVVHRLPMPHIGDELHHYGWNTCSSCHGQGKSRR